MTAGRTRALERWDSGLPGDSPSENGKQAQLVLGGFILIVSTILVLLLTGVAAIAASAEPDPTEQTLAAIRDCMTRSPAPWPQAWQKEYVDTIGAVIGSHQDSSQYTTRLQIIGKGFPSYWEGLKKGRERSLFEVHCAEIRWYVETLMTTEVPTANDRQKLRDQWRALMDDAAAALVTQFPFLDPHVMQSAKSDYLAKCYRDIETPLLPTCRSPFSQEQIGQLQERWTKLRYARVDLWRQLGGGGETTAGKTQILSVNTHPDYLLTQRSLDQLRGQTWSLIAASPDYYRGAVAKDVAARKQRVQLQSETHAQEARLGVAVWQTEYVSFLLAALLETSEIPENAATGGDKIDEP